jgi:hypothetical protein
MAASAFERRAYHRYPDERHTLERCHVAETDNSCQRQHDWILVDQLPMRDAADPLWDRYLDGDR